MSHILIVTVVCALFGIYLMYQMAEIREGGKKFFDLFCLCGLVVPIIRQISIYDEWVIVQGISTEKLITVVYSMLLFVLGGKAIYGGIVKIILLFGINDFVMAVGEVCTKVLFWVLVDAKERKPLSLGVPQEHFGIHFIIYICVLILFCVIPRKFYNKIRKKNWGKYLLGKIVAIIYLIIIYNPIMKMMYTVNEDKRKFAFLCLFSVISFFLLFIFFLGENEYSIRRRNLHLFLQEQMIREQYKLQEEQFLMMRRMRHDIRKHLDAIAYFSRGDLPEQYSDQIEEYRNDLQEMYRNLSYGDYCSRLEVNASIYQLEKFCNENAVGFSAQLRNLNFAMLSSEELMHIFSDMVTWILEELSNRNDTKNETSELWIRVDGESASGVEICTIQGNFGQKRGIKKSRDNVVGRIEEIVKKHDGFVSVNKEDMMCKITVGWKR